jgi:hypothetical protein
MMRIQGSRWTKVIAHELQIMRTMGAEKHHCEPLAMMMVHMTCAA